MAHFTNQFDKIATELGTSVIYCHHHSKGSQGGKKSMDRSSGSGVFARDYDTLTSLVELAPKYYEYSTGKDDELNPVKLGEYIGISSGIKKVQNNR